jgi:hypothetical protein
MADYKLRVEVDEQELTKKLVKAFKEATKGFSDTFKGGSSGNVFSGLNSSAEELEKKAEAMLDLKKKMAAIDEASKTHAHKLAMTYEKQMQHRQTIMKLLAKENELLRRSGGHSGRAGALIGGLVGGRPGSAFGGMFDELRSMWSSNKDTARARQQQKDEAEKAWMNNDIDLDQMDEFMKRIKEDEANDKKGRNMKLVGIGAGLLAGAGLSKLIIDSSPLLQAMLKLLNVGIMLILRPIGDFIGFLLRPLLIEFVKKVAIPAYKGGAKLAKKWGDSLGNALLDLIRDPIGALTGAIYNALKAWFTGADPKTALTGGMTYDGLDREEGAMTPDEFIGEGRGAYESGVQPEPAIVPQDAMLLRIQEFISVWNTFAKGAIAELRGLKFPAIRGLIKTLSQGVLRIIGRMNDLFLRRIPNALKMFKSRAVLMMVGMMNKIFQLDIPKAIRQINVKNITTAFKGLNTYLLSVVDKIKNVFKPTKKPNTQSYDEYVDVEKQKGKPNKGLGFGNLGKSFMKVLDILMGYQFAVNPQKFLYEFPGFAGEVNAPTYYDEPTNIPQCKNLFDLPATLSEIFESIFPATPTGDNVAHACTGYKCTSDFGELISDDFKEIEGHTVATNETALGILERWQNMNESASSTNSLMDNIETFACGSEKLMCHTEGHFSDIEKNMGDSATMMQSLIDKVSAVLSKAKIRAVKDDATREQKDFGRSGAIEEWQSSTVSKSNRYKITWGSGMSNEMTLSPAALQYYNNLRSSGQGNILSIQKMAKGGILNEPVLGFGQKTGKGYLMGESGPEAVVPLNGKDGSSGGGNTFNITINASNIQDVERKLKPTILRILKESTSRAGIV